MKALLLEDHNFFGEEIAESLREQYHLEVSYAHSYDEAIKMIQESGPFDYSFLDILLQNGRTGIDVVNQHAPKLGKILFITGCVGESTLEVIKEYNSASKLFVIWPKIEKFLAGERVSITA